VHYRFSVLTVNIGTLPIMAAFSRENYSVSTRWFFITIGFYT